MTRLVAWTASSLIEDRAIAIVLRWSWCARALANGRKEWPLGLGGKAKFSLLVYLHNTSCFHAAVEVEVPGELRVVVEGSRLSRLIAKLFVTASIGRLVAAVQLCTRP